MLCSHYPKHRSVVFLTVDRQIDRRIFQQADTLEASGWSVSILAMPYDNLNTEDDPRVTRIKITPKKIGFFRYLLLMSYRMVRKIVPMHDSLMQQLKKIAWKYFANQKTFYLRLFSNYFPNHSSHVVVAVDLPMLPVGIALSRFCGARLVYDSHELYAEQELSSYEKKNWQHIEAKYIHHCDAVITVNPSIASELERRYNIHDVNVIYNAVPLPTLINNQKKFHAIFNLEPNRKILLFQGGLSKDRHLECLVQAMCYVKHSFVDLVILGEGQLASTLQKKACSLGIKNRVYFHAAVSQEKLLEYTQSADAGIIPYQATCLNHYYCTPNKLFEFIAAGVPILGSDLPEINNIINTHGLGLTGDMSTAKSLANLIDYFFSDDAQLQKWKHNVLTKREHFSWEEKKLLAIFEDLA